MPANKVLDSDALGLHAHLRAHRRARGITLKQMGEAIGLAESTLSLMETEGRGFDVERLVALATYFGVGPGDLLAAPNEEPPIPPGLRASALVERLDRRALEVWLTVGELLAERGKSS